MNSKRIMQTKNKNWLWEVFFLLYIYAAISSAAVFFFHDPAIQNYYRILVGFNMAFLIFYLCHVLAIILDILAIIPFYLYIKPTAIPYAQKYISPQACMNVFVLRVALLFIGHGYDYKQMQALLHDSHHMAKIVITIIAIFYVPSYFANFMFALQRSK